MSLWWQKWPGRLVYELQALDAAGIPWSRDEESERNGVFRLLLTPTVNGRELALVATYPDLFPYFRVEVAASTLDLPHHQNPFGKNLCLLGRRTHFWDTDNTVARLIEERLPLVLRAGQADSAEAAAGLEQEQAEPFSNYYPYAPAMLIVQSEWIIPSAHSHGTFRIASATPDNLMPSKFVRGAVVKVFGERGEVLAEADGAFRTAFPGKELEGAWVRAPAPIKTTNQGDFLNQVIASNPFVKSARPNHVVEGWLTILGVLFPEEVAHRTIGDGWIFLCCLDQKRPRVNPPHFRTGQSVKNRDKAKRRGKRRGRKRR